jgi:hypothetical protein
MLRGTIRPWSARSGWPSVQVDLQLAADDEHELLGVRVVVLRDPLARRDQGDAHEPAGGPHGRGREHGSQVAAAPSVRFRLVEVDDADFLLSGH